MSVILLARAASSVVAVIRLSAGAREGRLRLEFLRNGVHPVQYDSIIADIPRSTTCLPGPFTAMRAPPKPVDAPQYASGAL
jgi:hypothetical protein